MLLLSGHVPLLLLLFLELADLVQILPDAARVVLRPRDDRVSLVIIGAREYFILVAFCRLAMLLEASMSAGVVATFQPLAVSRFSWGSDQIAAVNFLSSFLSIVLSLIMAHLRLPERAQSRPSRHTHRTWVFAVATTP